MIFVSNYMGTRVTKIMPSMKTNATLVMGVTFLLPLIQLPGAFAQVAQYTTGRTACGRVISSFRPVRYETREISLKEDRQYQLTSRRYSDALCSNLARIMFEQGRYDLKDDRVTLRPYDAGVYAPHLKGEKYLALSLAEPTSKFAAEFAREAIEVRYVYSPSRPMPVEKAGSSHLEDRVAIMFLEEHQHSQPFEVRPDGLILGRGHYVFPNKVPVR